MPSGKPRYEQPETDGGEQRDGQHDVRPPALAGAGGRGRGTVEQQHQPSPGSCWRRAGLAPRAHQRHQRGADGRGERGDPQAGRDGGSDQRGEARHRRGPDERAGQVVEREPGPRHRAGAGEHRRDDADAGDEAAEEDGLRAVPVEEALAALERVRPQGRERAAVARQDRAPAAPPEPVAERVAQDRRGDRDADDEREREPARAGEHPGREQRGLTREGDARGLPEDQREEDRIAQMGRDVEHRDRSCRGAIGPS